MRSTPPPLNSKHQTLFSFSWELRFFRLWRGATAGLGIQFLLGPPIQKCMHSLFHGVFNYSFWCLLKSNVLDKMRQKIIWFLHNVLKLLFCTECSTGSRWKAASLELRNNPTIVTVRCFLKQGCSWCQSKQVGDLQFPQALLSCPSTCWGKNNYYKWFWKAPEGIFVVCSVSAMHMLSQIIIQN